MRERHPARKVLTPVARPPAELVRVQDQALPAAEAQDIHDAHALLAERQLLAGGRCLVELDSARRNDSVVAPQFVFVIHRR